MKYSIYIFLILFSINGFSQCYIQGRVSESLNFPIEYVNCSLLDLNGEIIEFYVSDSLGIFNFDVDSLNLPSILEISTVCLGYKSVITKAINLKCGSFFEIILEKSNYLLEPIEIKAKKPPILQRNDTIFIDPLQFADGTENKLKDLLKKIPGIEVSNSGKLTYYNEPVTYLLFDGDDFVGPNYGNAVNSVTDDLVKNLEIIKDYHENKLWKGLVKSNDIAVNIKIKDSFFGNLSWSGINGFGAKGIKYDMSNNIILLAKSIKSLNILEADNTEFRMPEFGSKRTIEGDQLGTQEFINLVNFQTQNLPQKYSLQGNSKSIQFNQSINSFHKKVTTKLNTGLANIENFQNTFENTLYLSEDSIRFINETQQTKKDELFYLSSKSSYVNELNNFSIDFLSDFSYDNRKQSNSTNRNETNISSALDSSHNVNFGLKLDLNHKQSDKSILQWNTSYNENNKINNNIYKKLLWKTNNQLSYFSPNDNDRLFQNLVFATKEAKSNFRYLYNSTIQQEYLASTSYTIADFNNFIRNSDQVDKETYNFNPRVLISTLRPGWTYANKKYEFVLKIPFNSVYQNIDNRFITILPGILSKYYINGRNSISLFFEKGTGFQEIRNLHDLPIVSTFQSIETGLASFNPGNKERAIGQYTYNHIMRDILFKITTKLSKNQVDILNVTDIVDGIITSNLIAANSTTKREFDVRFNKTIFLLKINVKTNFNYSNNDGIANQFGQSFLVNNKIMLLNLDLSTAYKFLHLTTKVKQAYTQFNSKYFTNNLLNRSGEIGLTAKSRDRFYSTIRYNFNHTQTNQTALFYSVADLYLDYNGLGKKKNIGFSITLNNLFNAKSFAVSEISQFYQQQSNTPINNRFFVIKVHVN